ncbi:hypothetical protein BHYA_0295g00040 [Botrytis hyacinthi]|uniref:Uncharacterized protein n=1 Tax=Botrytis hyacinthi TaxID=278943 RepID=A0A4Z1G6V3_9HELO|nr:hypothetical protein BHYA_0295g00040 [Botrytis hyacinthi]
MKELVSIVASALSSSQYEEGPCNRWSWCTNREGVDGAKLRGVAIMDISRDANAGSYGGYGGYVQVDRRWRECPLLVMQIANTSACHAELEKFRKSPEEVMAKDRMPKNLKRQGRDERCEESQMNLFRPEMGEASLRNFDGGNEPHRVNDPEQAEDTREMKAPERGDNSLPT